MTAGWSTAVLPLPWRFSVQKTTEDLTWLDHSPAHIVAQWLVDQGLATNQSAGNEWPVYIGFLPDSPNIHDNAIAVFDDEGLVEGRLQNTGETIEQQAVQVRVRARDYDTAYSKIDSIADKMDDLSKASVTLDSIEYTVFHLSQKSLFSLGQEVDIRRRQEIVLNALGKIERA